MNDNIYDDNIYELEQTIQYKFKDISLLRTALTHKSYANENKRYNLEDNERMEFLGDAVLELISSDILYKKYNDMPEGEMTRIRASLVCEPTLAMDARDINLGKYLLLGKGEDATGGRERDSLTSDALEAVIGAVYLDGGLDAAYGFIQRFVMNNIESKKLFSDCKTHLQELVMSMNSRNELKYRIVSETGPEHNKLYVANVWLNGEVIGTGNGRTKKAAQQSAAYAALISLDKRQ